MWVKKKKKICGLTEAQRCSVNCPGIKSLSKKEQSELEKPSH